MDMYASVAQIVALSYLDSVVSQNAICGNDVKVEVRQCSGRLGSP
jgi:hypothetical protein